MAFDHLILIILVGFVAGFLATHLVAGHGFGVVGDIIVGVLGSLLGFLVLGSFLIEHVLTPLEIPAGSILGQTIISFIGAAILLVVLRLVSRGGWRPSFRGARRRRWL